jgi:tetratricopeptide (TPR) repeat protein
MMVDHRRAGRIFPILILLLILLSCAQMKNGPSPQAPVQALAQAPTQARQHLAAGDYQKTIDSYKAEYVRHPQDQVFVKEYVKSLEEIKAAGDRASDREDLASAGKTYNILLKNYPDFKGFAHMLSFDRAQLNTKLTNCKTALSKKGFQEYREGNLSEAISLWQGYLAIDPNNADIKKALNTAKLQQKNLQQKK